MHGELSETCSSKFGASLWDSLQESGTDDGDDPDRTFESCPPGTVVSRSRECL